jgi:hypothetical protein
MLDVAQPLMAAAPRLVSALLSGFAAPASHPTIGGFAAYFNAYTGPAAPPRGHIRLSPGFRPFAEILGPGV